RWFLFAAGFGFDAAVVAAVERERRRGQPSTHALYVRLAVQEYLRSPRGKGPITLLRADGTTRSGLHFAVVANTSPWTYLGERPVTPTPAASFETGLSLYARRRMGPLSVLRGLADLLSPRRTPGGGGVLVEEDLPGFVLRSSRPTPMQVDGDFLGEREEIHFRSIPRALSVIV
nr:diacylglycerol kinase family lipid kinase [Actinomycetota bacterium]